MLAVSAGCTEGSTASSSTTDARRQAAPKAAYERELRATLPVVGQRIFKLSIAVSRAPSVEIGRSYVGFLRRDVLRAERRLSAATPPPEVTGEHRRLLAALRRLAVELDRLDVPTPGVPRPFAAYADQVARSRALARLRAAVRALARKGYTIEA